MVQNGEHPQAAPDLAGNMPARRDLVQYLAHETRNSLAPIKLSAERILRRCQNDPYRLREVVESSAHVILKEVDSLTALLDELRILSCPVETNDDATVLSAVLDETVSIFGTVYPDIRFHTDAVDRTLILSIDSQHLRRVLNNLIINAIDAVKTKGSVTISAGHVNNNEGIFAQISITDSGPGIDDEAKDKIFTPYWTSKPAGTGLGLPIAEHVVRDYGGSIRFTSEKGAGTTFIILLPRKKPGGKS
jgi:signal transduction histidine kinase